MVNEVSRSTSSPKSANNTSRLSNGLPRVSKGPSRISSSPFRVNKNLFIPGPSKLEAAIPAPATTTAYNLDDNFLYSLKDFQPFQSKNYHGECICLEDLIIKAIVLCFVVL